MKSYKHRWPKNIPHHSSIWNEIADKLENGTSPSRFICNILKIVYYKHDSIEHLRPIAVKHFGAFKGEAWWLESNPKRIEFCRAVARIQMYREQRNKE